MALLIVLSPKTCSSPMQNRRTSSFKVNPFVMLFGAFVFLLLCCKCVQCALQNISIDDTNGDPMTKLHIQYNPPSFWSFGPSCQDCEAHLNSSEVFNQTWHDTTFLPNGPLLSASATFTGSAVYVMCILTGSPSNPDGNSDMTLILDNKTVGSFQQGPDGNPAYLYNSVVFSMDGLPVMEHNITLLSGELGQAALVLLDRIIYTAEVPDQPKPTPVPSESGNTTNTMMTSTNPITSVPTTSNTSALRHDGHNKHIVVITTAVLGSTVTTIAVAVALYRYWKRWQTSGLHADPWLERTPAPDIREWGRPESVGTSSEGEDGDPPSYTGTSPSTRPSTFNPIPSRRTK